MHISAHADVDVVALEQDDEVHLLLELVAPPASDAGAPRLEHNVVVVLDRSGSMAGGRLEAAKEALVRVVERLDDRDRFGLVVFDQQAEVVVPAGRVGDSGRPDILRGIRDVRPGGTTDLSAGYFRGLQEARRVCGEAGATIVLVSDGHANSGIVDPTALRQTAARAAGQLITTSTVGIGEGYDDTILDTVATGGQGNHSFAHDGDGAAHAVCQEVDGLLSKVVQAANVLVSPTSAVSAVEVLNALPVRPVEGGLMVELGDLYAGETQRLALRFDVPVIAALGLAEVAELTVGYVSLPDLVQHTVSIPVTVNVVPADLAAGRVRDPKVVEEVLFASVQKRKRESLDAMRSGDLDAARTSLTEGRATASRLPESPALSQERQWIDRTLCELDDRGLAYSSRRTSSDVNKWKRGTASRDVGGEVDLSSEEDATPSDGAA
jgi:Ca-activated chloride channel family protein